MTNVAGRLLPDVRDPRTARFWQAAREHRLMMQRCSFCAHLRWPAKSVCPVCLQPQTAEDWTEIVDEGAIWSFAVYHRAFHPSFNGAVPYNVVYVKLDAGPLFVSNVVETNALAIGQRVKAHYEDVTDEVTLVKFRLIE